MCNKLAKVDFEQWNGFKGDRWKEKIDVRNFISMNYTPYDGDASFLEAPTEATDKLWGKLQELQKEERAKGGVLDMETDVVSGITAYGAAYIDDSMKDLEQVVGLQTDKPLKRAFMPYGGIKMAEQSCETYGYKPSEKLHEIFTKYHKTHNQGVFDIYTPEMKRARHNKILTGLPDTYGRGRIVGDYRRVALYGIDFLIAGKEKDFAACDRQGMRRYDFQLREEIADQIRALKKMKEMAQIYGFDISQPAKNAKEAFQWLYFGYLAAIKTQNGAAMSVGRISTFLDIYIERDLKNGVITEKEAQELVDHMVMKFRMVKFARIPSYNELFSYTEDAIFQFHVIESKHRAFLTQGQFVPVHCEGRAAGLLQDDPRSVVIPWRGSHGYKQICPACGHFTQFQGHGTQTADAPNLPGEPDHPLLVGMGFQKGVLQARCCQQQLR